MQNLSVEQKFAKIMVNLRQILPYYSTFYEAIEKIRYDAVDTIGVTCKEIIYNYKFIANTNIDKLMFINLHEICHIALLHSARVGNRHKKLWNIACDLYVNKLLSDELNISKGQTKYINNIKITFPNEAYFDKSIDVKNDSVDSIYDKLYKELLSNNTFGKENERVDLDTTSILTKDLPDEFIDLPGESKEEQTKIQDAKRLLAEVEVRNSLSKEAGNQKGLLEIQVDEILKSRINWKKYLKKYCRIIKSSTSSFARPDKRMYYQKAIYPGKTYDINNRLEGIKICIDTSGSINNIDLKYIIGQVNDILKNYKMDAELIFWDWEIESKGLFSTMKEFKDIKIKGGGGTSPRCLFEYFDSKECKIKPVAILIFSDFYFNTEDLKEVLWKKKYKNTLWIGTRDKKEEFKAPFGSEARVEEFYQ